MHRFGLHFGGFWEVLGSLGRGNWREKSVIKTSSKISSILDRFWEGFGEGFGRVWGGLGAVLGGFGEGLGRLLGGFAACICPGHFLNDFIRFWFDLGGLGEVKNDPRAGVGLLRFLVFNTS